MDDLNEPNDVIIKIFELQRPGDVQHCWNENAAGNMSQWAGCPLIGLEDLYVEKYTSPATPNALLLRAAVE
jgi:hypothetical protein